MTENREVWVFADKPALLAELMTGARELTPSGGSLVAILLGARAQAEQALARGAAKVLWLGEPGEHTLVDDYVPTLVNLVEQGQPYALLIGATKRGRAIAGRLAARLKVTALTDVLEFLHENNGLQARHMIFGGGAVRIDRPLTETIVATVGPGVFDASAPNASATGGQGGIIEVPFVAPTVKMTLRERKTRPVAAVNLSGAKKVVCAGRGVGQQDDLQMIGELARLLGAELACTRPLAEGLGWLPRERYLGISGATIRPDLYLGVGVSGQVQHMIGMNRSRVVVVINKDQNAPIFANADYGIAADLYAVVPALINALKNR